MVRTPKLFLPPHCPRRDCLFHYWAIGWRWKKAGFHRRLNPSCKVQRYTCVDCGASFSSQSFRTSYWLKRADLVRAVFFGVISCSSYRQIARQLGVSHTTVMRIAERLGRHCLLFQQRYLNRVRQLEEPIVVDGFETFEFSQYTPVHFNNAVGARSHFVYGFTDSELRRKGRMTPAQKARRAFLERTFGRPDPKAIEKEVAELLRLLPPGSIELRTDEHRAYPRAVRRSARTVRHATTSSREARTPRNPLFPANLWDLIIRHSSSNHKRETIAFSKRRQNAAEKLAVLLVWKNFLKSFSEKRQDATPAMRLGLVDRKLSTHEVLEERLFITRIDLPVRLQRYYFRKTITRRVPNGRTHDCVMAF